MRVIITVSGIQGYIFSINERQASKRLRGRSSRLGLVIDLCRLLLQREFGALDIKRDAGSRLEIEFRDEPTNLKVFLEELRHRLDRHSREELDGQVWFAIAEGTTEGVYQNLGTRRLNPGRSVLQKDGGWNEQQFVFTRCSNERALEDPEEAGRPRLPDAKLGGDLARLDDALITLTPRGPEDDSRTQLLVIDYVAEAGPGKADSGVGLRLPAENSKPLEDAFKHVARHAPTDEHGAPLDLDTLAKHSAGAPFLGVLKADLDNLGTTFETLNCQGKTEEAAKLSRRLETFFTEKLESVIEDTKPDKADYSFNYIVYSGGDDLFMLGPWDALLRLVNDLHEQLRQQVGEWGYPELTLSAGFKLAHPKSPVRFLAEDVEAAVEQAKGKRYAPGGLPAKNRIAVFERVLDWDELRSGLEWADRFIEQVKPKEGPPGLSAGFLQRMQYYASQFRRLERGGIEGLRTVPLLQNDWHRNIGRVNRTLRDRLNQEIRPLLVEVSDQGKRAWRVMDFATQFAIYAIR
jgi:CRISPR-associated protein Csm1